MTIREAVDEMMKTRMACTRASWEPAVWHAQTGVLRERTRVVLLGGRAVAYGGHTRTPEHLHLSVDDAVATDWEMCEP